MAVDGSIRVETKLDTKPFERGLEDVDKMCENTKKHLEKMADTLNLTVNVDTSEVQDGLEMLDELIKKAVEKDKTVYTHTGKTQDTSIDTLFPWDTYKERLKEIETEMAKMRMQTKEWTSADKIYFSELQEEATSLQDTIKRLQEKTNKANAIKYDSDTISTQADNFASKIKTTEKQQTADIKSVNSDVSGTVASDDFISKIKNAEQYDAALDKVRSKMQTIEQETARLVSQKGINADDALAANKEYQKLKKQYDKLIDSAGKFKRSSKGGFDAAASGAKSLGSSMKSAMKTMAKYTLTIFGARSAFYAVKNAIRQVLSDNEKLNNTVTAIKGAFANALAPVIERIVYWLKYAFAYLNLFVKVLTGVDMAAQYNAKAINKQTEATKKNAKATKEANLQLASFDEKNVLNSNNQSTADDGAESSKPALLDLPDVSGGKFEEICENIKAHLNELEMIAAVALLATGFILLAVGQIPMGIACIIGGIALAAIAISGWGELSERTKAMISAIMAIAGGAFLAIGIILCATGVNLPLGIAMIVIGAALLAGAVALNWDAIKAKIETVLDKIKQIVLKAFLIVLGVILCATGVGMPLGIALIVEGIKAIKSEETLDWEAIKTHIETALTKVKNIITGVLMMVVGVLLCCSGVGIPLGVGLIIEGVRAIKSDEALDWEKMKTSIENTMDKVKMYLLNAGAIVVGVLLCATGVSLPLGLALILSGIKAFKTGETINSELILNTVKEIWAKIKAFWNAHIGYVFKREWWRKKFDSIKQGMTDALNGVISAIETAVNWIVSKVNILHFDLPDVVAKKVGFSSLGFNLPYVSLPRLAKGAIVNNPGRGRAVIAGEAGAEAILPLQNNTEWMDTLADKVAGRVSMNVINRITLDGKDINHSNRTYDSRYAFATNGGVL